MTRVVTKLLALSFAGAAFALPAATAQADELETKTIQADVDGDGNLDQVTLSEISADSQKLVFSVPQGEIAVTIAGDSSFPLQEPRRVDVNGDGQHEVLVAEFVGANTVTFNGWYFDVDRNKIFPTSTPDGSRLKIYEGGGVSAINGYSCVGHPDTGARDLSTVEARLVDTPGDQPVFDGARTTYHVDGGIAREIDRLEFTGVGPDDPRLATEPQSCATAG